MTAPQISHEPGEAAQLAVVLAAVERRLANLESSVGELSELLRNNHAEKKWYSTSDTAKLLSKSDFTVREKWCNQGRVECEKDLDSGKWRIPAHEVERLRNGGGLRRA